MRRYSSHLLMIALVIPATTTATEQPGAESSKSGKDLGIDEIRVIRQAVYGREIQLAGAKDAPQRTTLLVPQALADLYKSKPTGVLKVLLMIVDGASPQDSMLAAAYALELLDGVGVVCVYAFQEETYDAVRKHWKTTSRQHWADRLRAALKLREKEK